jgi:site-specific DNA recombinase
VDPSARQIMAARVTSALCEQNNYLIVEEFIEVATVTDDRRQRSGNADHPYNAIVLRAFNRFFRNVAEMELTIRKSRKHGVDVVSATQPTENDPTQILVHQIIGGL